MTLIALWCQHNQLWAAADSRTTFEHSTQPVDTTPKILSLDLRVRGASPTTGGVAEEMCRTRIGMAILGSATTSNITVQGLRPILENLRAAPGWTDWSLNGIADLIGRVLETVSRQVCAALFERGTGSIIVLGHCPVFSRPRAFRLTCRTLEASIVVEPVELDVRAGAQFFGSGARAARLAAKEGKDVFHALKTVINDHSVPSVGGVIQVGHTDHANGFILKGVRDFELDTANQQIHIRLYMSALPIEELRSDERPVITGSFILPFEDDIAEWLRRGYLPSDH